MSTIITSIDPDSPAMRAGLRAGQQLLTINGHAVVDVLVKKSYSAAYGARNLRRCIQKELEDPMANLIIDAFENPITQLKATAEDGQIKLYSL